MVRTLAPVVVMLVSSSTSFGPLVGSTNWLKIKSCPGPEMCVSRFVTKHRLAHISASRFVTEHRHALISASWFVNNDRRGTISASQFVTNRRHATISANRFVNNHRRAATRRRRFSQPLRERFVKCSLGKCLIGN